MTRRAHRPLIFVLVFLLVTWGTCPCVFAKMLGIDAETEAGATDGPHAGQPQSQAPC